MPGVFTVIVVLVLAAGPSASLFCQAWCDPHVAAENGCHPEATGDAAGVRRDTSCQDDEAVGVLNEDRRVPTADGGAIPLTARFQVIPTATCHVPAWNRGRPPSHLNQPQTTPLRI